MRIASLLFATVVLASTGTARAEPAAKAGKIAPDDAKEMERALAAVNQSLGLESYPEPHCLQREFGKVVNEDQVKTCLDKALKTGFPGAGKKYAVVVLMADVGPSTVFAQSLEQPNWTVLSCDPGKPCPPRKSGPDKWGKRVSDRQERACKDPRSIWYPAKRCP